MSHPSVDRIWRSYLRSIGESPDATNLTYSSWHFCDNEFDANECLKLVLAGTKRATTPALPWLQDEGVPIPQPGDLHVVTDWDGVARAVIRTTDVEIVAMKDVTAEHAAAEGEGDKSLSAWHRIHRSFYEREAIGRAYRVDAEMPVVCERFVVVHQPGKNAFTEA